MTTGGPTWEQNMAMAGMGLQTAGLLVSSYAAGKSAIAEKYGALFQASTARLNADLADLEAQDAIQRGSVTRNFMRREARSEKAKAVATLATSGLDMSVGSPLSVLAGVDVSAAEAEYYQSVNTSREVQAHQMEATGLRTQAGALESQARAIRPGQEAMLTFLGGASSVAGSWYQYSKAT